MAQPANSFSTYDAIGVREDLSEVIYNVDPTDVPFLSGVSKNKATNTVHEWQTDSLAAASDSNAVIEGDEATTDASIPTVRLTNITQISDKVARVTGTQEAVNKAGRNKEMSYQLVKRGLELKRDMEKSLSANKAKVAGNDSTARVLAGVESWIKTNSSAGTGGSDPAAADGTGTRTDGTQRVFKESQLKDVLAACWDSGGKPDCVMVGSFNKQKLSAFTGGSTRYDKSEDKRIVAAVDVYVSDFGEVKVIPNRFSRARSALVLQMDMWCCSYLRNMTTHDLAKTGDTERKQLICEYTLEAKNEKASGIVADLTTA